MKGNNLQPSNTVAGEQQHAKIVLPGCMYRHICYGSTILCMINMATSTLGLKGAGELYMPIPTEMCASRQSAAAKLMPAAPVLVPLLCRLEEPVRCLNFTRERSASLPNFGA